VPGAGTPPVPTDLVIISNDPTSVQYVSTFHSLTIRARLTISSLL
jgi:hypothetical protein